MFIEQETRRRGAEPFIGMNDHAPTSQGGGECAQQRRGAVLSCSRGSGLSDDAPTSPGGENCAPHSMGASLLSSSSSGMKDHAPTSQGGDHLTLQNGPAGGTISQKVNFQ